MSDALAQRIRTDATEHAAAHAWEQDHPQTPWAQAPESVRASMRGLVGPTVDAVLEYLRDGHLLDLEAEPDTFPEGIGFDVAVTRALGQAQRTQQAVRYVYQGAPVIAYPRDSWQDVAGRYTAAAEDAAR